MSDSPRDKAYELVKEFLAAVHGDSRSELRNRFHLSDAVIEEMRVMVGEFFDGNVPKLDVPPRAIAFSRKIGGRLPFDFYAMDEPGRWGCECSLWIAGKQGEPIMHFEFSADERDGLDLRYQYVGS